MEEKHKKVFGLAVVGVCGTVAVSLMAGSIPFVLPAFRRICLPYVPATDNQMRNVVSLLKNRKGTLIDLGSGDGRIVLTAAKMGFPSIGVELNPWLVLYSKIKASYLGLNRQATFRRQDIWKTDLNRYDNIVIFGVEQMMSQLEEKLSHELKDDACVIACRFPLPNWNELSSEGSGIDTEFELEEDEKQFQTISVTEVATAMFDDGQAVIQVLVQ
ncbi:ATP synthase subunit C lysine N-methyltransferase [Caerostris darwini]|uniref:ATP synthase subunit C lysine N-methyltransferase n=1 Tax=Caerostris darwini TaxID=1538125 RepID=A0AAV4RRA2_9ARAC|nr:ATP synthase subunit C lysine N-methyltransferase [Caerostris darwini]